MICTLSALMAASNVSNSLARGMWTLYRFGLSPRKWPARLLNRNQPKVLSVSVPKSGTHLVERALCLHPRLYRRILPTIKSNNTERWGDLERLLSRLRAGQVVVGHLPFEGGYPDVIARHGASALFLIRDPRDVVISEAHYVASSTSHRVHELFARQPTLKDSLLLIIRGDVEHGWLPMAEKLERYEGWLDSGALVLRFEDLIGSSGGGDDDRQRASLRAMFEHIGLPVDDAFLSHVAERIFSNRSPTFRKGLIGGWQEAFDDQVREEFDRTAGPYLERYGYAPAH